MRAPLVVQETGPDCTTPGVDALFAAPKMTVATADATPVLQAAAGDVPPGIFTEMETCTMAVDGGSVDADGVTDGVTLGDTLTDGELERHDVPPSPHTTAGLASGTLTTNTFGANDVFIDRTCTTERNEDDGSVVTATRIEAKLAYGGT